MVAHAQDAREHRRDALGGPYVTDETVRFGAPRQDVGQVGALLGGELWRRPGRGLTAQGRHPARAGTLQPAAHRRRTHLQRLGDRLAGPAFLMQFPGADAPPLPDVLSRGSRAVHARWCTTPGPASQTRAAISRQPEGHMTEDEYYSLLQQRREQVSVHAPRIVG